MSQQNSKTPRDFLRAVEHKFNVTFTFDIACTTEDCVAKWTYESQNTTGYYFDQGVDALEKDWSKIPVPVLEDGKEAAAWQNPPWKKTGKFAKKSLAGTATYVYDEVLQADIWTPGIRIFSLYPAGVGTKWFAEYVHNQADVYFLSPRITYIDPRTGEPFIKMVNKGTKANPELVPYLNAYGKTVPQTGLNDAILVDWAGEGSTYCWDWKRELALIAAEEAQWKEAYQSSIKLQDALNRV